MRKVVCNTSCLIALANIGQLSILKDVAKGLGLLFTGTLGVVVKATQIGLNVDLRAIISDFRKVGFRIPNDIEAALLNEDT